MTDANATANATATATATTVSHRNVRVASRSTGSVRSFNEAGILAPADVHVARCLSRLGSSDDDLVMLGTAFAVRAPRLGHTCVDLSTIRTTADADVDMQVVIEDLPWPDPETWTDRLRASSLCGPEGPLHLEGSTLYLDRYWSDERQVALDLLLRASEPARPVDLEILRQGVARLLGGDTDPLQRLASVSAVLRRFTVVAGGPGTGKTTTVARILALLYEQFRSAGSRIPLVALGAPTGKAAARLQQAVIDEATRLDVDDDTRLYLAGLRGSTLHRLLGRDPQSGTRFRHNRTNPLPHDVVIVDETSMVSLSVMARLVEAVRKDARLILVGDPEQLASVEAGAVLGDVVGPATDGLRMTESARVVLGDLSSTAVDSSDPPEIVSEDSEPVVTPIGDGTIVLRRVHRFGEGIGDFASAVKSGDADAAVGLLLGGSGSAITWIAADASSDVVSDRPAWDTEPVRLAAVDAGRRVFEAARAGNAKEALSALGSFRLLCAHRRGPVGATTWAARIERWMAQGIAGFAPDSDWYPGRPLLVTQNDYGLNLFNGDTGVVLDDGDGHTVAAFEQSGDVLKVSPSRLEAVETVYAMTVHKSQGSQFDTVGLILPAPDSPILTRELLYTAVTRATQRVILVGSEEALRTAVERPIARSSGLRRRLWGS